MAAQNITPSPHTPNPAVTTASSSAAQANPAASSSDLQRCALVSDDSLPGTAKPMTLFVAVEYLHGWGHDIMDPDVLGADLSAHMAAHLREHSAVMQFIRKPGRAGQFRDTRKVFVADTIRATMYSFAITSPEQLLSVDLTAVARGEWGTSTLTGVAGTPPVHVDHPMMLVCTHGKRDQCCALRGRPVAAAMQACFAGDEVWETSHSKGHRFAPTMILMPWGYSYGRISAGQAIETVKSAARGVLSLAGVRGRGCWDSAGQAAEIAVLEHLAAAKTEASLHAAMATGMPAGASAQVDGEPSMEPTEEASPAEMKAEAQAAPAGDVERRVAPSGGVDSRPVGRGEIPSIGELIVEECDAPPAAVINNNEVSGDRATAITEVAENVASNVVWRMVSASEGRQWYVGLRREDAGTMIASCGDAPKLGKQWVVAAIVANLLSDCTNPALNFGLK